MSAIVTITFNPAIDKYTTIDSLIPEKKLRCSSPSYEAGGGGVNVARVIKRLGKNVQAIYMAGGYNGQLLHQLLNKEQIHSIPINIKDETRENITVLDKSNNQQYRFCLPGPVIEKNKLEEFFSYLTKIDDVKFIIASGSLPPGMQSDVFAKIALIARQKKAKFIVDTSGESLRKALEEGVYLLKPNRNELAYLIGKDNLPDKDIEDAARQIIQKNKCMAIVVSLGSSGALLVTKDISQFITAPPVTVKSTVGAGDSMLAGIVFSLSAGNNFLEAAKYGVACGTAAVINEGTQLCKKDDADRLFELIDKNNPEISINKKTLPALSD